MEDYGCRDLYLALTARYNKYHHTSLKDLVCEILRNLFFHARAVWEGETHGLKMALIPATTHWEALKRGNLPCPIQFDSEDVVWTLALDNELRDADESMRRLEMAVGFASAGCVPIDSYAEAKTRAEKVKRQVLEMLTKEERADTEKHWPLDDMDEAA